MYSFTTVATPAQAHGPRGEGPSGREQQMFVVGLLVPTGNAIGFEPDLGCVIERIPVFLYLLSAYKQMDGF